MFLIVRDEDVPTVAAAINAFADDQGLEPIELEAAQNPLAMLSMLQGPRVLVSASADQVIAFGLESLDIAETDEWGSAISAACETEVLAIELAADGLRVYVFDGGELDEEIELPLDGSGRTRAPQLAELTDREEGQRELEQGIAATTVEALLQGVLRCFGVGGPGEDSAMLAFVDPLGDEGEIEPRLNVAPLPAAAFHGRVGEEMQSPHGNLFALSLEGVDAMEGVRLTLSGDGLALLRVDALDVALRLRGAHQQETRRMTAQPDADGTIVVDIADAFLERADARPPVLDASDLFTTLQRMMSAGDTAQLNTLFVNVIGTALRAGVGTLALSAAPASAEIASGEATVPVHVA